MIEMNTFVLSEAPEVLKLLGHDLRWQLVSALAQSDRRVQELVAATGRPQNLVSYHLRQLRDGRLVAERRSSADGRDVYYTLELEHLRQLYWNGGGLLHPLLSCIEPPKGERQNRERPLRVLFLCTHNSARSQMAEALLQAYGGDGVVAASAGSEPAAVHPLAIRVLAEMGVDGQGRRSKHMDEFAGQAFDVVVTVCDRVREVCPVFADGIEQIHWSIADPAAVEGAEAVRYRVFQETAATLATRIRHFLIGLNRWDAD